MFDRLAFVIGEAIIALRRNGFMTFAAVSTVAVSLFLLGGMGYLIFRFDEYIKTAPGRFDVRVFMKEGTTTPQIQATAKELRAIDGVKAAFHIPRDRAWDKMRRERPELYEGIENPLPDAFKVTISDLAQADRIVSEIKTIKTVDSENGVQYLRDEIRFVEQAMGVLRWLGGVLGGTLLLTAGILIYNAIRLTILARRREVRIMQLVGASRWTIQIPYLIEGLFQGIAGGTMAGVLLFAAHQVLQNRLSQTTSFVMPPFETVSAIAILGTLGGLYGLMCSTIALRLR